MLMTTHAGKGSMLSHLGLSVTPWTAACQAPLSMGFLKQEYWNGLLFPPRGNLPNPGIKPQSPTAPALAGTFFTTVLPGKLSLKYWCTNKKLTFSLLLLILA